MKSCVTTCIRSPIHNGRYSEMIIVTGRTWIDDSLWDTVAASENWKRKSAYLCEYHIPTLLLKDMIHVLVW